MVPNLALVGLELPNRTRTGGPAIASLSKHLRHRHCLMHGMRSYWNK